MSAIGFYYIIYINEWNRHNINKMKNLYFLQNISKIRSMIQFEPSVKITIKNTLTYPICIIIGRKIIKVN